MRVIKNGICRVLCIIVYKYQKPRVCRYNAGKYILFCDYTTFHLRGVPNQLECKNKAFTFGDYLFI